MEKQCTLKKNKHLCWTPAQNKKDKAEKKHLYWPETMMVSVDASTTTHILDTEIMISSNTWTWVFYDNASSKAARSCY